MIEYTYGGDFFGPPEVKEMSNNKRKKKERSEKYNNPQKTLGSHQTKIV